MFDNLGFTILYEGCFNRTDLNVQYSSSKITYSRIINDYIDNQWKHAQQSSSNLYNGKIFGCNECKVINNELFLDFFDSSYKTYYVTRTSHFTKQFGQTINVNPVTVGAIIQTSDNKLLFGKRLQHLDSEPGQYSIPAGIMDGSQDFSDDVPDPFHTLCREMWEEKCIKQSEVSKVICLGVVYGIRYKQIYLPFSVQLNIASDVVMKKRSIDHEFSDFFLLNSNFDQINKFVINNLANISQTCIANIVLWIKYQYNDDSLSRTLRRNES